MRTLTREEPGEIDWFGFLRRALPWIVLGFVLRLAVFELHGYIGNADQVKYTLAARYLLQGELPSMRPGLAALIASAIAVGIPEDRAAQTVSLATGTLMLFLIWYLAKRLYGRSAGIAALIIAAFNHHLIRTSTDGMKEAPMLCALLGALICLDTARGRGHALVMYVASGALFGVGYTIRSESLVYFVGVLAGVATILVVERMSIGRTARILGLAVVGFAILGVPGTILRGSLPTLSDSVGRALLQYDPMYADKGEAIREKMKGRLRDEWLDGLDAEVPQPRLADNAKRYVHNLYAQLASALPSTIDLPLWSLCILGLFGAAWKANRWKQEIVFFSLWLFFFTAAPLAQLVHVRHLLPYLVIACCWAGAGAAYVGRWYVKTTQRTDTDTGISRKAIGIVVALVCLFQLKPDLDFVQSAYNGEIQFEEKAAGLWLGEYGVPENIVLERKTVVAYYANMNQTETPYTSYDRCIEYARSTGARFLVVSARHTEKYRPQLAFLLDKEPKWGTELRLIHEARNEHAPDLRVRIFEIVR